MHDNSGSYSYIKVKENEEVSEDMFDPLKYIIQIKSKDDPTEEQFKKWYKKYGCEGQNDLYVEIWGDKIKIKDHQKVFKGTTREFLKKYFVGNPNTNIPLNYVVDIH